MRGACIEQGQILQDRSCVGIHIYHCTNSVPATVHPVQDFKAYLRTLLLIFLTLATDGAECSVTRPCR
jgi:hypothetical protein